MKAKKAFIAMGQSDRSNNYRLNFYNLRQCSLKAKEWYFIGFYGY